MKQPTYKLLFIAYSCHFLISLFLLCQSWVSASYYYANSFLLQYKVTRRFKATFYNSTNLETNFLKGTHWKGPNLVVPPAQSQERKITFTHGCQVINPTCYALRPVVLDSRPCGLYFY